MWTNSTWDSSWRIWLRSNSCWNLFFFFVVPKQNDVKFFWILFENTLRLEPKYFPIAGKHKIAKLNSTINISSKQSIMTYTLCAHIYRIFIQILSNLYDAQPKIHFKMIVLSENFHNRILKSIRGEEICSFETILSVDINTFYDQYVRWSSWSGHKIIWPVCNFGMTIPRSSNHPGHIIHETRFYWLENLKNEHRKLTSEERF